MKLTQTKKIDDKEYQISELTVKEIITLINEASFFKKPEEDDKEIKIEDVSEDIVVNGILNQIEGFSLVKKDIEDMMKLCCNFELKDLLDNDLAPSEIKELIIVFREVNAPFLVVLKSLKILEMLTDLWDVYLMGFSKKLVT